LNRRRFGLLGGIEGLIRTKHNRANITGLNLDTITLLNSNRTNSKKTNSQAKVSVNLQDIHNALVTQNKISFEKGKTMNDFYQKTSYHLKILGGGVVITVFGIVFFVLLEYVTYLAKFGLSAAELGEDVSYSITTFNILFIVAVVPVVFLFYLFIFILEKDVGGKITIKHAGFLGMALGLTFVLTTWLTGSLLIGYRISWEALLRMLLNGLVSALLPGYLAGHYCYKLVKRGLN
jgi:hypothetical protein